MCQHTKMSFEYYLHYLQKRYNPNTLSEEPDVPLPEVFEINSSSNKYHSLKIGNYDCYIDNNRYKLFISNENLQKVCIDDKEVYIHMEGIHEFTEKHYKLVVNGKIFYVSENIVNQFEYLNSCTILFPDKREIIIELDGYNANFQHIIRSFIDKKTLFPTDIDTYEQQINMIDFLHPTKYDIIESWNRNLAIYLVLNINSSKFQNSNISLFHKNEIINECNIIINAYRTHF